MQNLHHLYLKCLQRTHYKIQLKCQQYCDFKNNFTALDGPMLLIWGLKDPASFRFLRQRVMSSIFSIYDDRAPLLQNFQRLDLTCTQSDFEYLIVHSCSQMICYSFDLISPNKKDQEQTCKDCKTLIFAIAFMFLQLLHCQNLVDLS